MNEEYYDDYYDDDDYYDYDDDDYDDYDRALLDCGYDPEHPALCHDIGSEWCSFFCPFHDMVMRGEEPG